MILWKWFQVWIKKGLDKLNMSEKQIDHIKAIIQSWRRLKETIQTHWMYHVKSVLLKGLVVHYKKSIVWWNNLTIWRKWWNNSLVAVKVKKVNATNAKYVKRYEFTVLMFNITRWFLLQWDVHPESYTKEYNFMGCIFLDTQ